MASFNLNSAVDKLLKRELDQYRILKQPHPIMQANGLEAIPFEHKDMEQWRSSFKGLRFHHEASNFIVSGAIDDLWIGANGINVVEYKATATNNELSLDTKYREGYKRQLELYQWLLRRTGLEVDSLAYVLYANADNTRDSFDKTLHFELTLLTHIGDDSWVEPTLIRARECLMGEMPDSNSDCEWCRYLSEAAVA